MLAERPTRTPLRRVAGRVHYAWLMAAVTLLVLVKAVERRRWVTLAVLAVCLLGFVRQPCELFFPNIWTVAGVGIFVLAVWENRLFRQEQGG